ncbi:penicillin-binding protein [Planotetraspora sp. A-T 1434]|uniref:transglycosylase domain-containing protein n=1 Tax=Planotetraspora sp. A-T 1434 TaxID=2979219 RepID=UPI0021BE26AB|nr:transglycosylase domain-containing protein [Planotetraspora sp. A-T 1434]MCT9931629.1 penicillin-binding protein [Planotetraspora sp. A-T 1434]
MEPDEPARGEGAGRHSAFTPLAGPVPARPAKKPGKKRRRLLRILLVTFAACVLALTAMIAAVWALTPIPDTAQPLATAQGSVIYYRDGRTVLATEGVNRKNVPLSQVPQVVRSAVIAAENRTFYQDKGVSLSGTARAMWSTLTGHQLQGGSTITQQMVRNYYSGLGQERSIGRKLKEIMISLKVDRSKSKDWVLEQYLNTIYFGRGAYGIQAASRAYFAKDVRDLTPAEGAYLAAVIQQPSRFADPRGADLDAVRSRWKTVVDGMVETGALSRDEAERQAFPELATQKAPLSLGGQNGYMLAQVRAELNRMGYTDEDINHGGLKITTTFDKKLMALAAQAVKSILPDDTPKNVRTGLAAVDPDTGEVVAFYGGRYETNQYDNAFSAKVQAGSTFKPYTLAAALEAGYGLGTRVNGNSPMRVASAEIPNSDGRSYGSAITLVDATRHSVNTAFVDLGQIVGLKKVAAAAEAAGIPAGQLAPHESAPTFPLGVASVSAVQQASGFGTFAAQGVHHAAHVIRSVTDAKGQKKKVTTPGTRAFSEDTAADTTYALEQVVQGGTGTAARLYDRPVAGKTGTTDESAAVWFSGYVPQLSVAVNMFRDDNKPVTVPGYGELYGGTLPAEIWKEFMSEAMDGKPVKDFPDPVSWDPYYYWDGYGNSRSALPGTGTASPSPGDTWAPEQDPSEGGTGDGQPGDPGVGVPGGPGDQPGGGDHGDGGGDPGGGPGGDGPGGGGPGDGDGGAPPDDGFGDPGF